MIGADGTGMALASAAVLLVGGSVAASSLLVDYPALGGQATRYLAAGLLLVAWARLRREPLPRPVGREWAWLAGLAAVGLAGCSVLLIAATRAADPAAVGVVIGAAPLVIAVAGPIATHRWPSRRLLAAACIVTAGAASTQLDATSGQGWTLLGILLSVGALGGVAGTSLLATPVLPRLGTLAVSVYACALAGVQLLAAAVVVCLAGGPPVLPPPTTTELAALTYLAMVVTAVVFVAWYAAVERLGVERTGLFNGLIPIASLTAVALVGTSTITGMRLAGAIAVLAGLSIGLTARHNLTQSDLTIAKTTNRPVPQTSTHTGLRGHTLAAGRSRLPAGRLAAESSPRGSGGAGLRSSYTQPPLRDD